VHIFDPKTGLFLEVFFGGIGMALINGSGMPK